MYGPRSFCAMQDQMRRLRHHEREQCDIISQLMDQLQERNQGLGQLERKICDLKNQVRQLEGHLERELQKKQTLYYKNMESHEFWDTVR